MKGTTPSWRTVTLSLLKWEGVRTLFSLPNYLAIFLSLCVAWIMLNSTINTVRRNGILVTANPFLVPFLATLLPYAIFLALAVAISLAREMEGRTMEVLFYAPVRFSSFVVGRFLGQMTYYLIAFPFIIVFFLGYATSMNLRITPGLLGAMALSPFTVSSVVGFGFLTASCLRRARLTAVVLLATISVLLAIQFGYDVLASLQASEVSTPMILLSEIVNVAYRVIEWVSPFVFLAKGVDAAQIGAPYLYGTVLLGSIAYTGTTLALSVLVLRRRGFSK